MVVSGGVDGDDMDILTFVSAIKFLPLRLQFRKGNGQLQVWVLGIAASKGGSVKSWQISWAKSRSRLECSARKAEIHAASEDTDNADEAEPDFGESRVKHKCIKLDLNTTIKLSRQDGWMREARRLRPPADDDVQPVESKSWYSGREGQMSSTA